MRRLHAPHPRQTAGLPRGLLYLPIPSCPAQSGANAVPIFPLEMIARRAGDKRANVAEQQPVEAYAVPLGKLDNTLAASFRRAISPRPIEKAAIRLKP